MKHILFRLQIQLAYNLSKFYFERCKKWNDRYEKMLKIWYCGTFKEDDNGKVQENSN